MIEAFEKASSDWRHIRIKHIPEQSRFLLDSGCLVLDTETTGLGFDDEVCEICIMDASGTTLLDTLVRPTKPIPAEATAIHGITNDAVSAAPTMADIYPALQQIIGNRLVVVYNANFDGRLMAQSCRMHQLERVLQPEQTSCLMIAYAELRGEWDEKRRAYKWATLRDACEQMGIEWTGTAHRAAADTAMTLALLRAMACREVLAMKIEITPEMRARLMHAKHIVIGISDCVPDGYRVVPVEPTREMCEAFHLANGEYLSGKNSELMSPVHQWNAMLDAAPEFKLVDVSGGAA